MPSIRWASLLLLFGAASASDGPSGLLCDFQKQPALGIRAEPGFSWIVPACRDAALQSAYQIVISDDDSTLVWDTGKVPSNNSAFVEPISRMFLLPGAQYTWTVKTWSTPLGGGQECESAMSASAKFVTALFDGWSQSAKFIGLGQKATFAYLRKELVVPSGVVSASAFVTAQVDGALLSGYKLYIDGAFVDLGPGRGEAPVWNGDGAYRSLPYATLDVTSHLSKAGSHVLALQAMHAQPAAIMQINLRLKSGDVVSIVTDDSWQAFNADVHRNPAAPQSGHSAGTGFLESIDARHEPVGWTMSGFKAGDDWTAATATAPSSKDQSALHAKMGRPLQVTDISVQSIRPAAPSPFPPSGPVACGIVSENEVLQLVCPNGAPIADVGFASWGLPSGSCPGNLTRDAKCDTNTTLDIVKKACVGKTACSVKADRKFLGDPCFDVVKSLAVELVCPAPTCGVAPEHSPLILSCPDGAQISEVSFASFGTPSGSCFGSENLKKNSKCHADTSLDVMKKNCLGKHSCSVTADNMLFGDPCSGTSKVLAATVKCTQVPLSSISPAAPISFVADFGREFQGGLRLAVEDGKAGQKLRIACGETLKGDKVGNTWGWEFYWTLRDGKQILEQHKYMECRFVSLTFSDVAPLNFTLSAWKVHYEWDEDDTSFSSSSDMLNAVWELSRYTLEAASLDTYTDSNTRERRPYEADGGIAASARLLVQREYMWPRHSHAWTIQNPTWPVEWQQLTPFLGWQDFQATGRTDLAQAFTQQMYDRSQIGFLENGTGLLDTSKMGRHIVDWMPEGSESDSTIKKGEFTASNHHSVSNGFCARGLDMLSQMLAVAGDGAKSSEYKAASDSLTKAISDKMWNGTAFCDGVCSEVDGNSRVMTNMFMLLFGLVPEKDAPSAWETVTSWGLEQMGDYGAFMYLGAISGSYYGAQYYDPLDNGEAVLTALTKCDQYSWCSEFQDNVTMTRESWHDGTYSHPWGTGAIAGAVWGVAGVHQTSPGFETFTVMPRIHNLSSIDVKVPTLRGFIEVSAMPSLLSVSIPCNTMATLCLPLSSVTEDIQGLVLDGAGVQSRRIGRAWCTKDAVSCGADGNKRILSPNLYGPPPSSVLLI